MTVYKPDKEGRLVALLPRVRVGNERLNKNGASRLSGKGVVCDEHGHVPYCFVSHMGMLVLCCRKCIVENCPLAKAQLKPNWLGDNEGPAGPEDPNSNQGPQMDNPVGHSY